MPGEHLLNLDWLDVLTAGYDHVVHASGHPQITIVIEMPCVSGEVPTLANRLGGSVLAVVVAREGVIGEPYDDLARLASRDYFVGAHGRFRVSANDSQLGVERSPPGTPWLLPWLRVDREYVYLSTAIVIYKHIRPESFDALLHERAEHRRSGVAQLTHARSVAILKGWIVNQHVEQRGYQVERSEDHTSELQSRQYLVCRLLLEK